VRILKYYELTCTTYLLKDIYFDDLNESLGRYINKSMILDDGLKKIHGSKGYKYYVYDNLFPRESDKVYKKGRVYIFVIRSIDKSLLGKMARVLPLVKDSSLKVISLELKEFVPNHISQLYTVTPAILTVDNRFWVKGDSIELLERRIQDNLCKKYHDYYNGRLEVEGNFIRGIEIKNDKTIGINYKNIRLMGNKFKILVKEDETSQKLATMALATGLLEKNSSNGMGFCISK
jgi:CRISPR-associated endoribonuclease Cas6